MKGVILAGGTGSRLHPLTQITNKHLLPIDDRPMVSFAIEALVRRRHHRADGRHGRDARRRVPAPARQRARVRHRPARRTATRSRPGGIAEALGPRRAVRRRRPRLRHARRQRLRALDQAGRRQLRAAGARRAHRARAREPTSSTCATSACPSSTATAASSGSSRSRSRRRASSPSRASTSTTRTSSR